MNLPLMSRSFFPLIKVEILDLAEEFKIIDYFEILFFHGDREKFFGKGVV